MSGKSVWLGADPGDITGLALVDLDGAPVWWAQGDVRAVFRQLFDYVRREGHTIVGATVEQAFTTRRAKGGRGSNPADWNGGWLEGVLEARGLVPVGRVQTVGVSAWRTDVGIDSHVPDPNAPPTKRGAIRKRRRSSVELENLAMQIALELTGQAKAVKKHSIHAFEALVIAWWAVRKHNNQSTLWLRERAA